MCENTIYKKITDYVVKWALHVYANSIGKINNKINNSKEKADTYMRGDIYGAHITTFNVQEITMTEGIFLDII